MKKKIPVNLMVFIIGLGLLMGGIYLIYPPAAMIGSGIVLMVISLIGEGK